MNKVKAAASIQNPFSGRLNLMFGAIPELRDKANQPLPFPEPSQNSCKESGGVGQGLVRALWCHTTLGLNPGKPDNLGTCTRLCLSVTLEKGLNDAILGID